MVKVLLAHCYYRLRGGEDLCFEAERSLLQAYGAQVISFTRDNGDIGSRKGGSFLSVAPGAALRRALEAGRPHLAHFHNTFPLLPPSAWSVCRDRDIPVVQTLHNYRLICPKAILERAGSACELCVGRTFAWPGVGHRCYRGSHALTAVVAALSAFQRGVSIRRGDVDLLITMTEFARSKFIQGGLPRDRLVVKPNFAPDPGPPEPIHRDGSVVYVGRLSEEKGVGDLLHAVSLLGAQRRLRIVGDGPERPDLERTALELGFGAGVFVGAIPADRVVEEMRRAMLVVVPSRCYESFPRVIVEAFASGRPVVGARVGAIAEIVREGQSGALFEPGSVEDLARALEGAVSDWQDLERMGRAARREYELRYTPEVNYVRLMGIYRLALERAGRPVPERMKEFPAADPARPEAPPVCLGHGSGNQRDSGSPIPSCGPTRRTGHPGLADAVRDNGRDGAREHDAR